LYISRQIYSMGQPDPDNQRPDKWISIVSCSLLVALKSHIMLSLKQISLCVFVSSYLCTWFDNKVRELIAVKVLHTSLLNTTVVTFKVLPLGSYAPMPAPSPPFITILELVLWNGLQSCRCITPDVINVIKMPSFQYFLYLREHKKGE